MNRSLSSPAPFPHTEGSAVTHRTATEEFLDVVLADDDLVDLEFASLVSTAWGDAAPPLPACRHGSSWPSGSCWAERATASLGGRWLGARGDAARNQRGPPAR